MALVVKPTGNPLSISWNCLPDETSSEEDSQPNTPLYFSALQFNPHPPKQLLGTYSHVLAAVSGNQIVVIRLTATATTKQHEFFVTEVACGPHSNKENDSIRMEDLHTVQWLKDPLTQRTWSALAVGGRHGYIRIIDYTVRPVRMGYLAAHTGAVTALAYCEEQAPFLLSGSDDFTVRLWNVRLLVCLALFKGQGGHVKEIITLDMHPSGRFFVSGSRDDRIKVWSLFGGKHPALQAAAANPHAVAANPVIIPAPDFTTQCETELNSVRWINIEKSDNFFFVCRLKERVAIWSLVVGQQSSRVEWKEHSHPLAVGIPSDQPDWFGKFDCIRDPFNSKGTKLGNPVMFLEWPEICAPTRGIEEKRNAKKGQVSARGLSQRVECVAYTLDQRMVAASEYSGQITFYSLEQSS
ncbi:uncharacterized protein LOC129584009 [Paramacrobiotus metropolitanus]|uniref:uncharacterized protein LOC129584009 n=1 Tax=Paramacrobiotus metropolitanus TaxID=2943436 RepID=UPI0024463E04|nr:uncharacterized protein LOC129584009 [Paramacrobiotus metropolitanus]